MSLMEQRVLRHTSAKTAAAVRQDEQRTSALLVYSNAGRVSNILGRPGCQRGCGSRANLRPLASRIIAAGRWPLALLSTDNVEGASNSRAESPLDGLIRR